MTADRIARTPLRVSGPSGRTIDQRLFLRLPGLAAASAALISRFAPHSRARRSILGRTVAQSLDAFNRRDLDAVVVAWHPDFEYRPERSWVAGGLVEPSYRGLDRYRAYVATIDEVWGGQNYLTPIEYIDMGERGLLLATGEMRAQASGVELTRSFALLVTSRGGRPATLQEYYDHAEALGAAGLPA